MGKTYISKNKAAQALEIPAAVMDWNFNKAVKDGQLKKDVDYIESKSEDAYFTLSGLLWAVATCNGNFRGAVALAEKLASNERQLEAYKSLQLKLPDIKSSLQLVIETIDTATTADVVKEKNVNAWAKNSTNLPPLNDEQEKWMSDVSALLKRKSKETGKRDVHIQRAIYIKMRSQYGIVWEQEKIDTAKRFDLNPEETKMTTIRCIAYNPKLRSLYRSILADYK